MPSPCKPTHILDTTLPCPSRRAVLNQPQGARLWRTTIWFLLPPQTPYFSPKTSHLITASHSPQPPLTRMIKGQACHLVSRPSLKGRQKREREWERKTPWHTGLMKAMNHSVVFKEHISGIINSAQRPEPGWTDRSLHQSAAPPPATRPYRSAFHIPKSRLSLEKHPHCHICPTVLDYLPDKFERHLRCNLK